MRIIWVFFGLVLLYFTLQLFGSMPVIVSLFSVFPWWSYFVVIGILFCGYKVFEGVMEDYRLDQAHLEREGQIYLARMQRERERRQERS